jgi:hypothetical protein
MVSVIVSPSAASLHNVGLYNSRNLYVFSWYQARQGTVNHLHTMNNGMRRNESANAIPHFHRPLDKVITFSDLFI